MAQTKTKTKASSKRSAGPKRSQPRSRGSTKKSTNSRRSTNSPTSVAAERGSTAADKATTAVGDAAKKAKTPLVAGGAALAGIAGGMVLGTRQAHRHSRMDKAIKLAHELQQVRQPSNGRAKRSPVEVVLEGLTSRRSRA
jgi:hypothetical protein